MFISRIPTSTGSSSTPILLTTRPRSCAIASGCTSHRSTRSITTTRSADLQFSPSLLGKSWSVSARKYRKRPWRGSISAWLGLFFSGGFVSGRVVDLDLHETERDSWDTVDIAADYFVPIPKQGTQGVSALVKGALHQLIGIGGQLGSKSGRILNIMVACANWPTSKFRDNRILQIQMFAAKNKTRHTKILIQRERDEAITILYQQRSRFNTYPRVLKYGVSTAIACSSV